MKNKYLNRSIISIILPIGLLFFLSISCQWQARNEHPDSLIQELQGVNDKQKGAHVFGRIDTANYQSLKQHNIEWITLVAWADQEDFDSPVVLHHNGDSAQIRNRNSRWLSRIESVRAAGFKVFVKPHVWLNAPTEGKWRSDVFHSNEENWNLWKESYRQFILRYARIAELAHAEMFCIGTELTRLSIEKPMFWRELIQEVRGIYAGKITYGANWYNEFEKITFWDDLDYIGIQAYFPLVDHTYPSVEQVSKGWKKHLPLIESIHKQYNRKILFTEMGYKSTAGSAIKPWEWAEDSKMLDRDLSLETQANCYTAFFNTVWKKEWFAGVHIWQLRGDFVKRVRKNNIDFTPQGKPAEKIITKGFE